MPHILSVTAPDDPRIEGYRHVRDRDIAGRADHFIAEGEVVLNVLFGGAALHGAQSLLLAEKRVTKLAPLLARLPEDLPVYSASQAVMDTIVGFPIHRGILALGRRSPPLNPTAALKALGPRAMVVALCGIANHDNIGGIFRNAAAFGADAVLMDQECCDPLYRKAIRVSVGASLIVPTLRFATGGAMLALLAEQGFEIVGLSPRAETRLCDYRRPPRIAALLGAEGPGLPEALLAQTRRVGIPMAPGFDSLNVATTSGIVLHHLAFGDNEDGS